MTIACDRCGAPLEVVEGQTSVKCAFCHATQTVAGGPSRPAPNVPAFPFGPPPTSPFAPGRTDAPQMMMPFRAPVDYARAQAMRGMVGAAVGVMLLVGLGAFVAVRKGVTTLRGLNIGAPATLGLFDVGPAFPVRIDRAGIAGGPIEASRIGPSCRGHFPRVSHALIRVRQPSVLSVTTVSNTDLTMAIHAPDGTFRCDDDSGEGSNPRIQGPFLPGDYHVWIGTFSEGNSIPFTLSLEVQATGTATTVNGLAPDAAPTVGVLDFTTEPGGSQRPAMATGSIEGSHVNPSCRGYYNAAPTAVFTLAQPRFVSITTTGSTDLTLLVRGPSGLITCDDDSGEGANPRIDAFDGPGTYQLWIGPYSQSHAATSYVLSVVSDPMLTPPEPNGLSPTTPPVFGTTDLDTQTAEQSFRGVAVGRVEGNGIDPSCGARFMATSHLALHTTTPRRVHIAANADHEVNVLMRGPDGGEHCIAGGRGAANDIDASVDLQAGEYQFWVGTWERERHVPFMLTVSPETAPPAGQRPQRTRRGGNPSM